MRGVMAAVVLSLLAVAGAVLMPGRQPAPPPAPTEPEPAADRSPGPAPPPPDPVLPKDSCETGEGDVRLDSSGDSPEATAHLYVRLERLTEDKAKELPRETLIDLLAHEDSGIRCRAMLAARPDHDLQQRLLAIHSEDPSYVVSTLALSRASELGPHGNELLQALHRAARSTNQSVRQTGLRGLRFFLSVDAEAHRVLMDAAGSSDLRDRRSAVRAMGPAAHSSPIARAAVLRALDDGDASVVAEAARFLGPLGEDGARAALELLTSDDYPAEASDELSRTVVAAGLLGRALRHDLSSRARRMLIRCFIRAALEDLDLALSMRSRYAELYRDFAPGKAGPTHAEFFRVAAAAGEIPFLQAKAFDGSEPESVREAARRALD